MCECVSVCVCVCSSVCACDDDEYGGVSRQASENGSPQFFAAAAAASSPTIMTRKAHEQVCYMHVLCSASGFHVLEGKSGGCPHEEGR